MLETTWKTNWLETTQLEGDNHEPNQALAIETSKDKEKFGNLSLCTEQIKFLQILLSNQNLYKEIEYASSSSMATIAHRGNTSLSYFKNNYIDVGWIIDTGASNHINENWTNFWTYEEWWWY